MIIEILFLEQLLSNTNFHPRGPVENVWFEGSGCIKLNSSSGLTVVLGFCKAAKSPSCPGGGIPSGPRRVSAAPGPPGGCRDSRRL